MTNKYYLHFLLCFCLLSGINNAYAQSWKWATQPQTSTPSPIAEETSEHSGAVDSKGNLYITGFKSTSTSGTLTFGSTSISGSNEAFIAKYDTNGTVLWARQSVSGPYSSCNGSSLALDKNDNLFVTGNFTVLTTFGTYTLSMGTSSGEEMFLVKYDQAGNVLWATAAKAPDTNNGASSSRPTSVATDKWGNTFVTGTFSDTVLFNNNRLIDPQGTSEAFIAKYNANGQCIWAKQSTRYNNGFCQSSSVATDDSGNAYITGYFVDTVYFGPYTLITASSQDCMFLVKYDSAGNLKWATQSYGSMIGSSVITERVGNIYVTGSFNHLASLGNDTLRSTNIKSLYLAKYNPGGGLIWVEQNNPQDTTRWGGYSLQSDSLMEGGGYLIVSPGISAPFYHSTTLTFGGKVTHQYISPLSSPDVLLQFDSSGHTLCASIFAEGFEDDGTCVAVSNDTRFIYATGDMAGSYTFGNDTIGSIGDVSFSARWQTCCLRKPPPVTVPECSADTVTLTATGGTTYLWNTGSTSSAITVSPVQSTNYSVVNTTPSCVVDSTIKISVVHLQAQACCSDSMPLDSSIALNVVAPAQSTYIWTPDSALSCNTCANPVASPTVATEYFVTVTDTNGCKTEDSVWITITQRKIHRDTTIICGNIFVPNAFSPNGDNVDDVEYVYGGCFVLFNFKIFDRWGNKVFETNDPTQGWNGTLNGKPMNTGVYDYVLIATQSNNSTKQFTQKGSITLAR